MHRVRKDSGDCPLFAEIVHHTLTSSLIVFIFATSQINGTSVLPMRQRRSSAAIAAIAISELPPLNRPLKLSVWVSFMAMNSSTGAPDNDRDCVKTQNEAEMQEI